MRRTSKCHCRTRRPARLHSYRPRLELLEDRLPPGDVLLGRVLASSWLGQSISVLGSDSLTATSCQADALPAHQRPASSTTWVVQPALRSNPAPLFAGGLLSSQADRVPSPGGSGKGECQAVDQNRPAYYHMLGLDKDFLGRLVADDFDELLSLPSSSHAAPKKRSADFSEAGNKPSASTEGGANSGGGALPRSMGQGSETAPAPVLDGAPSLRSSTLNVATGDILDGSALGIRAAAAARGRALAGVTAPGSAGLPPGSMAIGNPQAVPDEAVTDEDVPVNIYWLTYNDTDPTGDALTITGVTQGLHGSVVLQPDQSVTYSPSTHWFGTDTFTYTIQNSAGLTATGNVTVTVNHVKPPPTADAKNLATNQNTPVNVIMSGTDVEAAPLQFFVEDNPINGTLSALNGNTVTYVPNGNFYGMDTFTYEATDGQQAGPSALVTVTVNQVVQGAGVTITQNGGSTQVSQFINPGDPGNAAQYTIVLNTQPAGNVAVTATPDSRLSVTPSTLTFTPVNWSVRQTVTVSAVDDQVARPDPNTAVITHTAASADPNYNNIAIASVTTSILAAYIAGAYLQPATGPITVNEVGETSGTYTATLTSIPAANVTVTLPASNRVRFSASSLTFTPANWNTPQTITVTAIHDGVAEGYQTLTLTHTLSSADPVYNGRTTDFFVNILDADAPNAVPDEATTDQGLPVIVSVLLNDVDPQARPLSVVSVQQPLHGSAVINGGTTVTYTPQATWTGVDTFSYTISNGAGGSDTGAVGVQTLPVNHPPSVTNPGSQTKLEDDRVSLQINATDPDGDALLYTATGLPPGLVIEPMTGLIWGWVDPRAVGSYTTSVSADDLRGGVTTVSFGWTITHRNHPPVLTRWNDVVTSVGQPYGTNLSASDIDGDTLSFTVAGLPPGVTYDPVQNSIYGASSTPGTYRVQLTVSDGHGGSDQDTFLWSVLPSGPIPIATVDTGESGGTDIALVNPATPFQAQVSLYNPGDPTTPYPVNLAVLGGRSAISPSVVTLRDGGSAFVTITPGKVSQKVKDVTVTASVASYETGRAHMTNVGFVLPSKVRAPDTPAGMKNRITLGLGDWGSYYGAVTVAPNLLSRYSVDFTIQRPAVDDKYGNAAIPLDQRQRLNVTTQLVVGVQGTVQTAATPDGGGNADNLRLAASVSSRPATIVLPQLFAFAVAAIPKAVRFTKANPKAGEDIIDENTKQLLAWFWGVQYVGTVVSDSGNTQDLTDVWIKEFVKATAGSGQLKAQGVKTQEKLPWLIATDQIQDRNGIWIPLTPLTKEQRRKQIIGVLENDKLGSIVFEQNIRFYNKKVDKEPKLQDAKVIKQSGFKNENSGDKKKVALTVERTPFPNNGAEKGLLEKAATGKIFSPI